MGDMGDLFRDYKKAKKAKKEQNNKSSTALIKELYDVETKSPYHLVVRHNDVVADFWPSTGKYHIRGTGKYHRGIRNLIKEMGRV